MIKFLRAPRYSKDAFSFVMREVEPVLSNENVWCLESYMPKGLIFASNKDKRKKKTKIFEKYRNNAESSLLALFFFVFFLFLLPLCHQSLGRRLGRGSVGWWQMGGRWQQIVGKGRKKCGKWEEMG